MTKQSMRCANKAASEVASRMRAAGEQLVQDLAAGVNEPAAANKHPATPIAAGERCQQRAASSHAASAAGGSPVDHGPEIEMLYSGKSDSSSDSQPSAKPDRMVAETKNAAPRGSLDPELRHEMFGSSEESKNSSPGSNRSRSYSYEESAAHEDVSPHVDVDESSRSHRSYSRSNTRYCGDRGASSYVGTT